MNFQLINRWVALATRIYLGGVFIWAAVPKIQEPEIFALQIAAYELIPIWGVIIVSNTLPWLELAVGLGLVVGVLSRLAALGSAIMNIIFIAALVSAFSRGLELSCGCFGDSEPATWLTVWRDVAWLAMGVYIMLLDRKPIGLMPVVDRILARLRTPAS